MFRNMRRETKLMNQKDVMEVLKKASYGIISINGDDGYPMGVPVNYAMFDNKIVFHGAIAGYKFEALSKSPKVCFTVIKSESVIAEKFTTDFVSVMAYGKVEIVEDLSLKKSILRALIEKYANDYIKEGEVAIEKDGENTAVFAITIEDLKGKVSKN